VKRLAALITLGIAVIFPFGDAAGAQPNVQDDQAEVIKTTITKGFKAAICRLPPCGPEPPPSQYGSCDLSIVGPRLVASDLVLVETQGWVECQTADGELFEVARIDLQTTMASSSNRSDTEPKTFLNQATAFASTDLSYRCENYQGYASATITLPAGWSWAPGDDGNIFMWTLWRKVCII
jgi:hypothetical protein